MGCPCSAKNHPRQSGSRDAAAAMTASRTTQRERIGANRGDRWTGPQRQQPAAKNTAQE